MRIFQTPPKAPVIELLEAAMLPAADVTDDRLQDFFGCGQAGSPCGAIGLALHGNRGLLRSLVVSPVCRGRGCGAALVRHLEAYAAAGGIDAMYLLTETAGDFFARLGYREIPRAQVPAAIQATEQFSSLCPDTATVMCKSAGEA